MVLGGSAGSPSCPRVFGVSTTEEDTPGPQCPGAGPLIHPAPASLHSPPPQCVSGRVLLQLPVCGRGEGVDPLAQQGWVQARGLPACVCSYIFEGLKENQKKNSIWGHLSDKGRVCVFAWLMARSWVPSADAEWAGGWRHVTVKPALPP